MTDFFHCLAAVWCFELGGFFTYVAKDATHTKVLVVFWLLGSVFMALGWWLA